MATRLSLFGCPFDPEIGEDRLAMKRAYAALTGAGLPRDAPGDPAAVLRPYARSIPGVEDGGDIAIDGWALPMPRLDDPHTLTADASIALMHGGICRQIARRVRDHVRARPDTIPLMLGIDHSASGGAIEALSARHGPDNLSVVIFDAHLDAVPGDIRQDLLSYAREHADQFGPLVVHQAAMADAPDYDCGSFLADLIARDVVLPHRLLVLGCADLPAAALRSIDDVRIGRYLAHFDSLLARGMRVRSRDALLSAADAGAVVRDALRTSRDMSFYVSIDMDVGANAALTGVRFLEHEGLPAQTMLAAIETAFDEATARGNRLAGLDLMEFDFYRAGAVMDGRQDPTYDIALHIIEAAAKRLAHPNGRTLWDDSRASA